MWQSLIEFLEEHQGTCHIKSITSLECPGCGSQRALILLLKGEVWESFLMFPPLIPGLFMFGFLFLHLIFKFKNGPEILKYNFILVAVLMMINYIAKLF